MRLQFASQAPTALTANLNVKKHSKSLLTFTYNVPNAPILKNIYRKLQFMSLPATLPVHVTTCNISTTLTVTPASSIQCFIIDQAGKHLYKVVLAAEDIVRGLSEKVQ